jgi:hypothetical protein
MIAKTLFFAKTLRTYSMKNLREEKSLRDLAECQCRIVRPNSNAGPAPAAPGASCCYPYSRGLGRAPRAWRAGPEPRCATFAPDGAGWLRQRAGHGRSAATTTPAGASPARGYFTAQRARTGRRPAHSPAVKRRRLPRQPRQAPLAVIRSARPGRVLSGMCAWSRIVKRRAAGWLSPSK